MPYNHPGELDLTGIELRVSKYLAQDIMMLTSGNEIIGMIKLQDGRWTVVPFVEDMTAETIHAKTTCVVIPPLMMEAIHNALNNSTGVIGTNDSTGSE